MKTPGLRIVWIRFGHTTRREVIKRFEGHLAGIVAALERGDGLFEVY